MIPPAAPIAPLDVWQQPTPLNEFREAGVLEASDVHLATTLARLAGETDPRVVLAVALAARAPRHGHVGVDLAAVRDQAAAEPSEVTRAAPADPTSGTADPSEVLDRLPWPDPDGWLDAVGASRLVAPAGGTAAPIVVHAGLVYLERYRTYEQVVARHLLQRAAVGPSASSGAQPVARPVARPVAQPVARPVAGATGSVAEQLLTGPGSDRQRAAVRASSGSSLTVLIGGPGTGKTTTVAAMVADLIETGPSGRHRPAPRIALAAPTGKAAARLGEAFREAADRLSPELATALSGTETSTIHRLLRPLPGSRTRFRHDAGDPLPHDVVIVDESSMISLPLMARLLDAIRPDARLVVVGDPGQLASVETGSVLGDIAGPLADSGLGAAAAPDPVADVHGATGAAGPTGPLAGCITVLEHSRRFPPSSPLAELAGAIRRGDVDRAATVLADPSSLTADQGALEWLSVPADADVAIDRVAIDRVVIDRVRGMVVAPLLEVVEHAAAGRARSALDALGRIRVLCAHRLGGFGVERWNAHIEGWLAAEGVDTTGWYPGRPVLVTANDHRNRLYNGDLGVVVLHEERPTVAFEHGDAETDHRLIGPARLDAIETTHAMTIHKSQGSEFDHVVVILPPADSRLASRELLYTAITRARRLVTVVGDQAALAAAISQRTVRASRLRADLWERSSR